MEDGFLPTCPIYRDVTTFIPTKEQADVIEGVTAGFPCQATRLFMNCLPRSGNKQRWKAQRLERQPQQPGRRSDEDR